jgi:glycosyltransferase involved in cell wall biosynthesis
VKERYALEEPYLLAVGLLQPRKNLGRLLEAFSQVAAEELGLTLALVGRTGWGAEAVQERIARPDLAGRVRLLGAAPDEDLPLLYGGALALCYPSLYEGFGLPPLEAMACGTPVVVAGTTSLPEVVGDAGVLVDPEDVASIADGIRRVVTDEGLRRELSRRGLARAAQFSWGECARRHLALYRELAGQ